LQRAKAKRRIPPPVNFKRRSELPLPVSPKAIHEMAVNALSANRR
jgi:hypothetical protein